LHTVAFLAEAPGSATLREQEAALAPNDQLVLAGNRSFKELGEVLKLAGMPLKSGDRIKFYDFNCLPLSTGMLLRALTGFLDAGVGIEIVKPGIVLEPGGSQAHALLEWLCGHYGYAHGLKTHPIETARQGRKRILTAENYAEICEMLEQPNASKSSVALQLGIHRSTLIDYLQRFDHDSRVERAK